jgi:uncharacterized protein (DUF1697 family)
MPVFVCFLRGVNVGGNNKIKMADLKSLCEEAGLSDVSTYLQSGNIVFRSKKKTGVEDLVRKALHARTGVDVAVVLRTPAELRAVIEHNPIADAENPSRLLVTFLDGPLSADAKALLERERVEGEILQFAAREIYTYYPDGAGNSRMANAMTDRKLKVTPTGRNWNTVTALAEMAAALE